MSDTPQDSGSPQSPPPNSGWGWLTPRRAPYVFAAPFFLIFGTFMLYPLLSAFVESFFHTRSLQVREFVGLQNYLNLFQDAEFWRSVGNTLYFTVGTLFIQLPLSLGLALLLNSKWILGKSFYRACFFMPVLISGVFVAIVFNLILNPQSGLLNEVLRSVGLHDWFLKILIHFELEADGTQNILWLQNEHLLMPALILAATWQWAGFNMIYFLAGLQQVRIELYEAAAVDGAGYWSQFRHITLPGIKPIMGFVIAMSLIGSFQLFELPYILTPDEKASKTIVMYLYENGVHEGRLGYGAAVGWVLFVMITIVTVVHLKLLGTLKED